METELVLRIVVQQPPAGVDFALQKGHGSAYELTQKQRSKGNDLAFEFSIGVKHGKDAAMPEFTGPFVQGPRGGKFVYLDIGTLAGQADSCWTRRLKIPLVGITWEMVNSQQPLEAKVPGTGKDGGPSCAYAWRKEVGPDWRWHPATRRGGKLKH